MDPDRDPAPDMVTGLGRSLAVAVFTLLCLNLDSARAQDAAEDTFAAADRALDAGRPGPVWRWEAVPRARISALALDGAPGGRGTPTLIDYRLWFGDQRTEVGLGYLPRALERSDSGAATESAARGAGGTVLAFRHQISAQSRLTLDAHWGGSRDPQAGPSRRPAFDLGLESSPLHGLARGTLLRAQLNAHSHLALRLRGGQLGLVLGVRITGAE